MRISFRAKSYDVVFTDHSKQQMALRKLEESVIVDIVQTGEVKARDAENKFWVFKKIPGREDNLISVSVSLEAPRLIIITTIVNWRPR